MVYIITSKTRAKANRSKYIDYRNHRADISIEDLEKTYPEFIENYELNKDYQNAWNTFAKTKKESDKVKIYEAQQLVLASDAKCWAGIL